MAKDRVLTVVEKSVRDAADELGKLWGKSRSAVFRYVASKYIPEELKWAKSRGPLGTRMPHAELVAWYEQRHGPADDETIARLAGVQKEVDLWAARKPLRIGSTVMKTLDGRRLIITEMNGEGQITGTRWEPDDGEGAGKGRLVREEGELAYHRELYGELTPEEEAAYRGMDAIIAAQRNDDTLPYKVGDEVLGKDLRVTEVDEKGRITAAEWETEPTGQYKGMSAIDVLALYGEVILTGQKVGDVAVQTGDGRELVVTEVDADGKITGSWWQDAPGYVPGPDDRYRPVLPIIGTHKPRE